MKKNKKSIVLAVISLLLTALMVATTSMAWLSMNVKTESDGMQMNVEVTPNLVISDTVADLQKATAQNMLSGRTATSTNTSTSYIAVAFASATHAMKPATHDWNVGTATGLKYNTNPEAVSPTSGLKGGTTDLTFGAVTASATSSYYIDYTVYLASTDTTMEITGLTATMSGTVTNISDNAASIDVYYGSVSSANYMGTLNLATKDSNTVTIVSSTTTVPVNTGSSPITIVLRCYFDGALVNTSDASKTYINSATVKPDSLTMNVSFVATVS